MVEESGLGERCYLNVRESSCPEQGRKSVRDILLTEGARLPVHLLEQAAHMYEVVVGLLDEEGPLLEPLPRGQNRRKAKHCRRISIQNMTQNLMKESLHASSSRLQDKGYGSAD